MKAARPRSLPAEITRPQLAAAPNRLSFGMATEAEAINAEELRARVGELRRFL
jgi:hypothetical protein